MEHSRIIPSPKSTLQRLPVDFTTTPFSKRKIFAAKVKKFVPEDEKLSKKPKEGLKSQHFTSISFFSPPVHQGDIQNPHLFLVPLCGIGG
jgi:hypothetical protein